MKLWKAILCVLIVSLLVSMAIPMAAAPKGGGGKPPKDEEPPADPAIAFYTTGGRDNDKIWVMNDDGSNQAVVFEMEDFSITGGVSWSPDGNSIAWTGFTYPPNVPGGWIFGVWRTDIEIVEGVPQGSNLQQLTSEEGDDEYLSCPAWSPLSDEIAYWVHRWEPTNEYKIEAVSATGGTPYDIYTAPEGWGLHMELAWSSDGTQLATSGGQISGGEGGILIIDRVTGTLTRTIPTGELSVTAIDWARQGSNKLAFHDSGGTGMIYTMDIDTETVVPVTKGGCPSWSPDNSMIVYQQPRPGKLKRSISIYEFSTGDITQLTNKGLRPDWRLF
jgi:Tol biopolymer transport system component